MNRAEIEFHRAQSRLKSKPLRAVPWRQRVVASLFPRRTGATLQPVSEQQILRGHVTNDDRVAAYEQRKADLEAAGKALAAQWAQEDDRLVRARRKAMKHLAANRIHDRSAVA